LKGQHNIKIARRTVAKYRDILNIKSSRERADTS
jgi:DNA-directed RNA polymerase specialized sigma54-like protein